MSPVGEKGFRWPSEYLVTHDAISAFERRSCVAALNDVRTRPDAHKVHLGSITLPMDMCPANVRGILSRAGLVVADRATVLLGEPVVIEYRDIVLRPAGVGMGMHVDDEWYPSRVVTAGIPLNDLTDSQGGQTVLMLEDGEKRFRHEAGRLLAFRSKIRHGVVAPTVDRYIAMFWLRRA